MIKNIFMQLAQSIEHTINFVEIEHIKASGIKQLILKCVPYGQEYEKKLRLVANIQGGVVFDWVMSSTNWMHCADLIEGLLKAIRPGHQYLTAEGIDDALVEIAFME